MRSSAIRHVVRLRLTLVGPLPEIWREIVVDRDLSLAELRSIMPALFDGQTCRHHLFTDTLDTPGWSRGRRRWGDRWTVIDLRDPTIIEEATARIGQVMHGTRPLYYGHTCEGGFLVEIEAFEDDILAASAPLVQVTGGEGQAPLPCFRGAYEHAVLVGVLDDPEHPGHERLRHQVARTVGPWAQFEPDTFDLHEAQRRVTAALGLGAPDAASPRLAWILGRLPRPARAGLEQHLAACGLDLPPVVTSDEARALTRGFAWVIGQAVRSGGIPLFDGTADPAAVGAGAVALDWEEERIRRLITLARRGRLLYSRGGRLRANKRATSAAGDPTDLWTLLARDVVRAIAPSISGDLFLLAVADGSLADPEIGPRRSAEALALIRRRQDHGRWNESSGYGDDCDQCCDCPSDGSGTWHDLVAQAIRQAAVENAGDAVPVAAQLTRSDALDAGLAPEWFDGRWSESEWTASEWGRAAESAWPHGDGRGRAASEPAVDESELLEEVSELIELLSMLGLERADDGAWIVPPVLRELVRESLRPEVTRRTVY